MTPWLRKYIFCLPNCFSITFSRDTNESIALEYNFQLILYYIIPISHDYKNIEFLFRKKILQEQDLNTRLHKCSLHISLEKLLPLLHTGAHWGNPTIIIYGQVSIYCRLTSELHSCFQISRTSHGYHWKRRVACCHVEISATYPATVFWMLSETKTNENMFEIRENEINFHHSQSYP